MSLRVGESGSMAFPSNWNLSLSGQEVDQELERSMTKTYLEATRKMAVIARLLNVRPVDFSIGRDFECVKSRYKQAQQDVQYASSAEEIKGLLRECGGTEFLAILQSAIENRGMSLANYVCIQSSVKQISSICYQNDRYHYELEHGRGQFQGDVVPKAYDFFSRIDRSLKGC